MRPVKFAVVVFPGSNCDADCYHATASVAGIETDYVWHGEGDLEDYDCVILPGGFSYGDYLRAGAIARFSPVMKAVERYSGRGGLVLGICNGFQILCEAGLLPGALRRNLGLRFECRPVFVRVENDETPFTGLYRAREVIELLIAHGEGNYYIDPHGLRELSENGQIVFRYSTHGGDITPEANPNGSVENIAGVCNREGNVLGMMPHPERNAETLLGTAEGRKLFDSVLQYLAAEVRT